MTGSPVPTKDPIVEGERNLLSRIWVRFFQDLIKDVASYAAHASRHLTGGSDEVDGDKLDIDWTPANYTPSTSPSEASSADNLTAHLKGVDTVLGTISGHASAHITGGSDEVDGDKVDIDWTPANYTPSTSPSEADNVDNLTAHLKGVDTAIAGKASTDHDATHVTGGSDEIDGDKLDVDWTPSNYTPSTSPSEADNADNLTAHLKGVDTLVGSHASRHVTGASDEVDGDKLDVDWSPTNYTPSTSPSEADNADNLTAHLKGIDTLLGAHASRHITGAGDEIDGDKLDIDWSPTNYTPSTSPSEANNADNLTAHLKGIDSQIGVATDVPLHVYVSPFVQPPSATGQGTWTTAVGAGFYRAAYFYNSTSADGDNTTFTVYTGAGTYTLYMLLTKDFNRGVVDIDVDGTEEGSFDLYAASLDPANVESIASLSLTAGTHTICFRVDGQNGSSSDYYCCITEFLLYRTA